MDPLVYTPTETSYFLQHEVPVLLVRLTPSRPPEWGLMTSQHAIEHLSGAVRLSNGKTNLLATQPLIHYEPMRAVLRADRGFARNIKNPRLPATPGPVRLPSLALAQAELLRELADFFTYFEQQPAAMPVHMSFGPLTSAEWQFFHLKHIDHHFLQFGLLNHSHFPRFPIISGL